MAAPCPVIDVDTHITEPPDTWTSRMSSKWGDLVPHVRNIDGYDHWIINNRPYSKPGNTAMAGFDGTPPSGPATFDDMHHGAWDPVARLKYMDENQIYAQVLYPNLGGFGNGAWLDSGDASFALEAVQAYNDFQVDFASVSPNRFLPITSVPFWDVPAAVAEIERCAARGHRGINFCNSPDKYGEPRLWAKHWDPIWSAARDCGIPVNFHVGGGKIAEQFAVGGELGFKANFSRISSAIFLDNITCVSDLIHGGVCARFPDVNFVSVESGVGHLPPALEMMDWQWMNSGVRDEHPEYDLLPSEYFRRQIYGCFWFERDHLTDALLAYPDNMMFETDFPHPTCQHPGPKTPAVGPIPYIDQNIATLPEDLQRKVLNSTAARLYQVV